MAKQIKTMMICLKVVDGAPEDLANARVIYTVEDDSDTEMTKEDAYAVDSPSFSETVQNFWDAEIAAIKAREGIV
jgi:hypothetical protein